MAVRKILVLVSGVLRELVSGDSVSADVVSDGTANKAYSAAEQTKLGGIASGATANSSDAALIARENHTGTQAIGTVVGLQDALDALGAAPAWNYQTASYTLVLGDAKKYVAIDSAIANTLTVPPNSSVAFPVGTSILIYQEGPGLTTITAGAGVTIFKRGGTFVLAGEDALVTLVKRTTDTWILSGDIAA